MQGYEVVRLTVSSKLVASSPKIEDSPDEQAIAEHYGLRADDPAA